MLFCRIRDGERYALCHSKEIAEKIYFDQDARLKKSIYTNLAYRDSLGVSENQQISLKIKKTHSQKERERGIKMAEREAQMQDRLEKQRRRDQLIKPTERILVTEDTRATFIEMIVDEYLENPLNTSSVTSYGKLCELFLVKRVSQIVKMVPIVCRMMDIAPQSIAGRYKFYFIS